jgi:hypothetical protein
MKRLLIPWLGLALISNIAFSGGDGSAANATTYLYETGCFDDQPELRERLIRLRKDQHGQYNGYAPIAFISTDFAENSSAGTGIIIAPCYALTAAHVIFEVVSENEDTTCYAVSGAKILVRAGDAVGGRLFEFNAFATVVYVEAEVNEGQMCLTDNSQDSVVLRLNICIGDGVAASTRNPDRNSRSSGVGWMILKVIMRQELVNRPNIREIGAIEVPGYLSTVWRNDCVEEMALRFGISADPQLILSSISADGFILSGVTGPGASGSPVIFGGAKLEAPIEFFGLHTRWTQLAGSDRMLDAIRFTQSQCQRIYEAILKDFKSNPPKVCSTCAAWLDYMSTYGESNCALG